MAGRSPLLHDAQWPPQVVLEVNDINATLRFVRVAYRGGSVVLERDMNARPFVPEPFRRSVRVAEGRRGSDNSQIQRDEQVEALLLADLADDDARRPHAQGLLDQPAQLDLAGALEIRSAGTACATTSGSGTLSSKTSSAVTSRSRVGIGAIRKLRSVVLPACVPPATKMFSPLGSVQ